MAQITVPTAPTAPVVRPAAQSVLPTVACEGCGKAIVAVRDAKLCRSCERKAQRAAAKARKAQAEAERAAAAARKAETPAERATRSPLDFNVAMRCLQLGGEKKLREEERKLTHPPRRRGRRR